MIDRIGADVVEQTGVLDLIERVFNEFEAPEYSPAGIREFRDFIALDAVQKRLENGELLMWGYWADDKIVGMIATKPPCHVSLLFVDKGYHRRGIAKKLYQTTLDHYRENSDWREMTVNSSPYAVPVYHRLGFVDTDGEQVVNGLRFTPMRHVFR